MNNGKTRGGRGLGSIGMWARSAVVAIALLVTLVAGRVVLAQTSPPPAGAAPAATVPPAAATPAPAGGDGGKISLIGLFMQSFDLFTVLLVVGSLAGWTIIFMVVIEVRKNNIAPDESEQIILGCIKGQKWADLRQFTSEDDALVSKAIGAAMSVPTDDKDAVREAAEMAASEECARWFRKVEPLNVLGNLGPLLGLAGTVWGMILAFASLQASQGQASPAGLSGGIAKALFHTLLGLLLAVPCLSIYGFYRAFIDKLCTRALVRAGELVEMLPREARVRMGIAGGGSSGAMAGPPRSAPTPAPIGAGGGGGGAGPAPRVNG